MIITVASHKGGVGRPTTAVHLAAYLKPWPRRLLLDGGRHPQRELHGTRTARAFPVQGAAPELRRGCSPPIHAYRPSTPAASQ